MDVGGDDEAEGFDVYVVGCSFDSLMGLKCWLYRLVLRDGG